MTYVISLVWTTGNNIMMCAWMEDFIMLTSLLFRQSYPSYLEELFYSHIHYSGYVKGQFNLCECSSSQHCHHLIAIAKCLLIRVAGLSALLHGWVLVETHNGNFKQTVHTSENVYHYNSYIPKRKKSEIFQAT